MLRVRLVGELRLELDGRRLDASRAAGRGRCWRGSPTTRACTRGRGSRRSSGPTSSTKARAPASDHAHDPAAQPRGGRGPASSSPAATASASWTARTSGSTCGRSTASPPPAGATRRWRCAGTTSSPTSTTTGCSSSAEAHRDRVAELLAALGEAAESAGDTEAARAHARRRLELDPASEDAARVLMRRLARAGDGAAAVAAYEGFRAALRRDLGMAPSAETRALADELRSERAAAARRLPLPDALARAGAGRWWAAASSSPRCGRPGSGRAPGAAAVVLVAGEAGSGKTRLLAELAGEVRDAGATVLAGRCAEDGVVPFAPFTEALRPYVAAAAATLPEWVIAELARLLPELGPGAGPPDGDATGRPPPPVRGGGRGGRARRPQRPGAAGRRGPALGGPARRCSCSPTSSARVGWAPLLVAGSLRDEDADRPHALLADLRRERAPRAPGPSRAVRGRGRGPGGRLARQRAGRASRRRSTAAPGATRSSSRSSCATSPSPTRARRPTPWSRQPARGAARRQAVIDRRARPPRRGRRRGREGRGGRGRGLRARRRRRGLRDEPDESSPGASRPRSAPASSTRPGGPGATASPTRWCARR